MGVLSQFLVAITNWPLTATRIQKLRRADPNSDGCVAFVLLQSALVNPTPLSSALVSGPTHVLTLLSAPLAMLPALTVRVCDYCTHHSYCTSV